jgi:hypothetical protein
MRTRTLLLLAVTCGLIILVAGGVQLLRLANGSSEAVSDLRVGATATAGDLVVTVLGASESDGQMSVEVRTAGVDDVLGFAGFDLLAPPLRLTPVPGPDRCAALTVAEQTCTLVYDTSAAEGSARVLLLRRGEDERRWSLPAAP